MSRRTSACVAAVVGAAFAIAGTRGSEVLGHGGDADGGAECVLLLHDSSHEIAQKARGGGPASGGGNGQSACGKTYAKWPKGSTIRVFVSDAGCPSNLPANALSTMLDLHALAGWQCHSGLGESTLIVKVDDAAQADINVHWADLGATGILGQATTTAPHGVITHSDVAMNNHTMSDQPDAKFRFGLGDPVLTDGVCPIEQPNGTGVWSIDLLGVLTHEVGHALGVSHPTRDCKAGDPCSGETMFPCFRPEEYSRRALNPGDVKAISSLYGP